MQPVISRKSRVIAVLPAMFVPVIAAYIYFIMFNDTKFAVFIYFIAKCFILLWPIMAHLYIIKGKVIIGGFRIKHHIGAIPMGLGTGLIAFATIFGLYQWSPLGTYILNYAPKIIAQIKGQGFAEHYIALALFITVFHSLLEEYYWRWFVYGHLSKLISHRPAAIIGSIAFAGHHYVVLSQFISPWGTFWLGSAVGLGGYFWCYLYREQKTLVGSWACHLVIDAIIMIIGYKILFPL